MTRTKIEINEKKVLFFLKKNKKGLVLPMNNNFATISKIVQNFNNTFCQKHSL